MWTNVLKKLPKSNLVTNVFTRPQGSYEYMRYGDNKLLNVKDGKLVNVRQWVKQLKATTTATYDAIIDNAQEPELEQIVPLSSLTPIIAPFRNNALSAIKTLESKVKTIERGKGTLEEISHNDMVEELTSVHYDVQAQFEAMFDLIKTDINSEYANSLFGELSEGFETAETINPKMKTGVSPKQKDKLRFSTDTRNKVDVEIELDIDDINAQTNSRAFPRERVNINFNYQHLPITLPPALYDDITMGEEGQEYVQQKIINVLEGSVPLYVKRNLKSKITQIVDKSKVRYLSIVPYFNYDNKIPIEFEGNVNASGNITAIDDFIAEFMQNDALVQFEFSPDGNAPLNIIKMAVKDFYGMRTKAVQVNESGEIASLEDITALEPERQRLSEEEQEQTGGGYYPALESYLDRTSDEERSRLEQYKYTIDTNMEGGKHITTILLNNKQIFRFGYQMSGNENLIKIVSELIKTELEAVEI